MARQFDRLSAKSVASKKLPGYYADGGGLYLQVSATGSKSWVLCYTLKGRNREMGLGSIHDTPLSAARQKRDDYRKLLRDGVDPIEAKKERELEKALAAARSLTFTQCATAYIEAHRAGWKNPKHKAQWTNTLQTYCASTAICISSLTHLMTARGRKRSGRAAPRFDLRQVR